MQRLRLEPDIVDAYNGRFHWALLLNPHESTEAYLGPIDSLGTTAVMQPFINFCERWKRACMEGPVKGKASQAFPWRCGA